MAGFTTRMRGFLYLPSNTRTLSVTSAIWSIGASMASPFQVLYFAALGATAFQIGLLVAYSTGVAIVTLIIGGHLADTWNRAKLILIFSWVSLSSSLLFALIGSEQLIVLPLTLTSIGNIYSPASTSLMIDEIEPEERLRTFSVANAVSAAPSVFMPTVGGLLLTHFGTLGGIRTDYLCACIFGAVGLSVRTIRLRDRAPPGKTEATGLTARLGGPLIGGVQSVRRSSTAVKRLVMFVALTGIGTGLTSTFVPIFAIRHLSVNPAAYGLVVDIGNLVTVCLYLALVFLIQRIGARRSILLSTIASSVSNILLSQARTANDLVGWGVSAAFYTALLSPSLTAVEAEKIPRRDRGKILAVFSVVPNVAALPSQVLAGYLYSQVSPVAPFLASLLPFSVAAVLLYFVE